MKFDIFLSICQTEVDGYTPDDKTMFGNFLSQIQLADELGFGTAWVAETHLSCQIQKENAGAVIPYFKGEIGLNTDILQLAHVVFSKTKRINIGSAIRNIICNGGPIAHAEAIRTFLTLRNFEPADNRKLEIGFAAGRFPFSNTPYGFAPKTKLEIAAWNVIKNKYFQEATEIFLRLLRGEDLSSQEISIRHLRAADFRDPKGWEAARQAAGQPEAEEIPLPHHWNFEKVGLVPRETSLKNLTLTLGSHDPEAQILANQFLPTGVFNLSITPPAVIEETHKRMQECYHKDGGPWRRDLMPRTVMLFLNRDSNRAKAQAERAWKNYWTAMEKTLDPRKLEQAVSNTIAGNAEEVLEGIKSKYDAGDRLMLWFDFNNHDNEEIQEAMRMFMRDVAPRL